ncbi:TetR family transcriptional regulator C-terminal domain-containing protein [Nocardia sp. NPDC049149]|uniref:TetR family transcriptional regulator C-terminal domain-containing protein n=1 Tax=Nocardia sp. NPDC049149 TaxID=3364315 RepID=UPI003720929C
MPQRRRPVELADQQREQSEHLLAQPVSDLDLLAARLHALVDGLSLHGLAGHRTAPEMIAQLDAFLDEILAD